jgi:hypothetical protein
MLFTSWLLVEVEKSSDEEEVVMSLEGCLFVLSSSNVYLDCPHLISFSISCYYALSVFSGADKPTDFIKQTIGILKILIHPLPRMHVLRPAWQPSMHL